MQLYYSKNLRLIEPGLRPYKNNRDLATEFACGRSRFDFLAVDRKGTLVIIEFKLEWAPTLALGQVLGYIAVAQREIGLPARGVIIARMAESALCLAAQDVGNVTVYEYLPNARLERIAPFDH